MENIKSLPPLDEMKHAFYHRDASYDGIFFVAVHTTGIFCRPTCPARKPKEENITFYATARDAMFSGYRPCKRCRPLGRKRHAARLGADVDRQGRSRTRPAHPRLRTARNEHRPRPRAALFPQTLWRYLSGLLPRPAHGQSPDPDPRRRAAGRSCSRAMALSPTADSATPLAAPSTLPRKGRKHGLHLHRID